MSDPLELRLQREFEGAMRRRQAEVEDVMRQAEEEARAAQAEAERRVEECLADLEAAKRRRSSHGCSGTDEP